jgi:hypothetical protein
MNVNETQVTEILQTPGTASPGPQTPAPAGGPAPQAKADQAAVEQVQNAQANNDPEFARKFAALTRQQKELFLEKKKFAEEKKPFEQWKSRQELKKTNLLQYLQEEGLDYDTLIKAGLSAGDPPSTDDKLKTMEERLNDALKKLEEKDQLEERRKQDDLVQKNIAAIKKEIHDKVNADSVKYETIIAEEAFDTVYDVAEGLYLRECEARGEQFQITPEKKDEYLLKSLNLVEDHLFKQAEVKSKKYATLKKLGLKQDTTNQSQKTEKESGGGFSQNMTTTLNSQITPAVDAPSERFLSDEESKARAAQKLRWT